MGRGAQGLHGARGARLKAQVQDDAGCCAVPNAVCLELRDQKVLPESTGQNLCG